LLLLRQKGFVRISKGMQISSLNKILELYLESFRQEGVEAEDKAVVPPEKVGHPGYDARCVNFLCLEILHDLEKFVVYARSVAKLEFDLIEVEESVFNLEFSHGPCRGCGRRGR